MAADGSGWLNTLMEASPTAALVGALARGTCVSARGTRGAAATLLAGAVAVRLRRPVVLVVAHLDEADDALDDLERFAEHGHALQAERFGALEVLPGESSVNLELLAERLGVVQRWAGKGMEKGKRQSGASSPPGSGSSALGFKGEGGGAGMVSGLGAEARVLVAPVQALMQGVPEVSALGEFTFEICTGATMPPGRLLDWLDRAGYRREDAIDQPGDFAVRGGLIDLFPVGGSVTGLDGKPAPLSPVRLDFFGDEIETLHAINPDGLGSRGKLARVSLVGGSALQLQTDDRRANLIDLLPAETVPLLHETLELSEQARGYYERLTDPRGIFTPAAVFQKLTQRLHAEVNGFSTGDGTGTPISLQITALPTFDPDAKTAIAELGELATDPGNRVVVLCSNEGECTRLGELLDEYAPDALGKVELVLGTIHRGFAIDTSPNPDASGRGDGGGGSGDSSKPPRAKPAAGGKARGAALILVPHHELFHRYETRRRVRRVFASTSTGSDAFLDLNVGDYVVHMDHGIAKFTGLKKMRPRKKKTGEAGDTTSEGTSEEASGGTSGTTSGGGGGGEYLTLQFAGGALLHVPASQIDLIQKYIGGFEGRPPVSHLGGKRWKTQKKQVADAVKDLAKELLQVQAARATQPGIRFPADTPWQSEFEAEFPYDETDDQLAAIASVKHDMAEPVPMDRLVCGDVGFGKTEVAIRAAFKAAEFGKQVAVLVPTTVLAEQHERTFKARMADYPFKVASVSRFKSPAQARALLDEVKAGRIDILIGTHRLLSSDVAFADLGLVIIDEEQRFGVEHKNKLLAFRLTADVMTLTATPIPRTLHMSMVGLRDISSLTTPPVDRRAIVTEVIPYDPHRIQMALYRELNRDGQAFFVHNRVHNLQSVADELKRLVPEARIAIGHGQMPPRQLEEVMLRFMRREADILVSTTIIESGIDIPTANTMLINQADHFGLAELHQLRGRVGRYKHRAYCYLLLPPDRTINEVAVKRLRAIENYAMLGAGFKIAMRDLEIRGAGNLLGAEQSGHIAAVGYELYCLLLEQETKRLRNEPLIDASKTHLDLPVAGTLPKRYIPSDKHRMDAYRRLTRVNTLHHLEQVAQDLADAYGPPPPPAQTFIDLMQIRIAAASLGIRKLQLAQPDLIFTTDNTAGTLQLFEHAPGHATAVDPRNVYYRPPSNYLTPPATLLAVLRKLLVRPLQPQTTTPPPTPTPTHTPTPTPTP